MTPRELIDATLKLSGHGDIAGLEADIWRDLQPDFRTSHYLDGFAHADRKFHFKADWARPPLGLKMGDIDAMPGLPDHWRVIEEADEAHPFRLATSPSRSFLNTSFNETPSSQAREGKPSVMIHPLDAASLDIADGDAVTLGNTRGETSLIAKYFDGVRRGVLIAESDPSEPRPYRRQGHQRAHRRRGGGADRRRRVPRQQGLDPESVRRLSEALPLAVGGNPANVSPQETNKRAKS